MRSTLQARSPISQRLLTGAPLALLISLAGCADGGEPAPLAQRATALSDSDVDAAARSRAPSKLQQPSLSSYDLVGGEGRATLLGLMYDVRVRESGEVVIKETDAVLPDGSPVASWSYTLGKPLLRRERASEPLALAERATLKLRGGRLSRDWGVAVEHYDHQHHSLKHSLLLNQQPKGDGDLLLSLPLSGDSARHELSGGEVAVYDNAGKLRLVWSGLVVTDLDGNKLPASFVAERGALSMRVDTRGARFPILIDPIATNPATTLEGDQATANFGTTIHGAGDVNNDGFDDLLVGQPNYTHTVKSGRALLFLGSATGIQNAASWSLVTNVADDRVGDAVSSIGDVDGDGFDDIAIGAPQAESAVALANEGTVWAYRGAAAVGGTLTLPLAWTRQGGVAARRLGQKLAPAGDVNCDGKPDLIIAGLDIVAAATMGHVEVHSGVGGAQFFSPTIWTQTGESNGFGDSISTAGNVNGAVSGAIKCDSIIVGDFSFDNGGAATSNFGKAYIYTGSAAGLSATAAVTRQGTAASERLGRSVSGGEDIDGDGLDDVLISSQLADSSGLVQAYLGDAATTIDAAPVWSATGAASTRFGLFVELLRDVTGDGRPDVAIAANGANANRGEVSIYFNSMTGLPAMRSWFYAGVATSDGVGTNVRGVGDVNGDTFNDFAISAAGATAQTRLTAGRVFVFHGGDGCTISGVSVGRGDQNPANPCEVCDPNVSATAWSAAPNGIVCDDGNACTQADSCQAGVCTGADPVVCAASEGGCRTPGVCDPATGMCSAGAAAANGTACDDGLFCNQGETCQAGLCQGGGPRNCGLATQCGALPTCDEAADACVAGVPLPNGTVCNDGDACTQTDTCQGGACAGANPIVCVASGSCNNAGTCNPATGMCSNPPKPNGSACNDGDACTSGDSCQSGACTGGAPTSCDDGDECTANTCDPATGCASTNVMDGISCADADGLACTAGACVAGDCAAIITAGCVIGGICIADGAANPANPCEVCDPARSRTVYSPAAAGVACGMAGSCDAMGDAQPAQLCDGAGVCETPALVECGLYTCDMGACKVTCANDADCIFGAYCDANVCTDANRAPVADAGMDVVARAETNVFFDGTSSSDPDGDTLTYTWEVISSTGPSMPAIINPTVGTPSLTLPRDPIGTVITVRLTVTDPDGLTDTDEVTATIQDIDNEAPVALIDGPTTAFEGDMINLNGGMSSDPEGDTLAFNWSVETPAGAVAPTLGATDGAALDVTFPMGVAAPTVYTFRLVVRDQFGLNSAPDEHTVTVSPLPVMDDVDMGVDMGADMALDMAIEDDMPAEADMAVVSDMGADMGAPVVPEGELRGSSLVCAAAPPAAPTSPLWMLGMSALGLIGWRRRSRR